MPKDKKTAKTTDLHKKKLMGFRFDPILVKIMDELGTANRRSTTAEIEMAMQEHAEKAGRWPPR